MKPIWIVDDDQSIRFVLEKALTREDLPVRSFTNPRDVLAALDEDEPQVLVSDIRMPGRDGFHLLTYAREVDEDLPVVLLTGEGDIPMAVSAMEQGAWQLGMLRRQSQSQETSNEQSLVS